MRTHGVRLSHADAWTYMANSSEAAVHSALVLCVRRQHGLLLAQGPSALRHYRMHAQVLRTRLHVLTSSCVAVSRWLFVLLPHVHVLCTAATATWHCIWHAVMCMWVQCHGHVTCGIASPDTCNHWRLRTAHDPRNCACHTMLSTRRCSAS